MANITTRTRTVSHQIEEECLELCGLEFTRTQGTIPFVYKDRGELSPAFWNDSDLAEFTVDFLDGTSLTIYGETEEDVVTRAIALKLLPNMSPPEMP